MSNKTYLCIKTFKFKKSAIDSTLKGKTAFTEGNTYQGHDDRLGNSDEIELMDDTGRLHTITAGLFPTLFKEQS